MVLIRVGLEIRGEIEDRKTLSLADGPDPSVREEQVAHAELLGEALADGGVGIHLNRIGDADDREARPVVRHLVGHHRQQALGRVPGLFPLLVIRLRVKAKVHAELAVEPGFAEGSPRPRTAVENEVLCVDDEWKHPGVSDQRSDELPRTKAPVPTE